MQLMKRRLKTRQKKRMLQFKTLKLSSVLNFLDQDTFYLLKPLLVLKIDNNTSLLNNKEETLNLTNNLLELLKVDLNGTLRETKTRSRQILQKITLKV